ncbi:MAG: formamidopyrimidine-DNA glycosylase [Actinobacteria bacterium]|nr:formamidopyrimidine-DNA glycosylase [Actinomycetota bacterium]
MPEGLEIELYRRLAERRALGRLIAAVAAPDAWFLKGGLEALEVEHALVGMRFCSARRAGKVLLLDVAHDHLDGGARSSVLGLRFGMTGRLLVDGFAGVDRLEYGSPRDEPAWDRFAVHFDDGGVLRLRDPRRLGGVELDPDESRFGPDAMRLTLGQLRTALAGSAAPLKSRLMDQHRVAGLGNLLVDEVLWRSSLDPTRPAGSMSDAELGRLHRTIRSALPELLRRGGSHTGELMEARAPGAACPRDGHPLERRTVGGRTTYSCPAHQR